MRFFGTEQHRIGQNSTYREQSEIWEDLDGENDVIILKISGIKEYQQFLGKYTPNKVPAQE